MVRKVDLGGTQIVHELQDLLAPLAEPDHDPGLGEHRRIEFLHALQQPQRMEIARTGTDAEVEPRHRLQIVVEHIRTGGDDDLERAVLAQEIRRQHLDGGRRRTGADGGDDGGEMRRPAVGEIVAIDGGDDDVVQPEAGDRLGHAFRFGRIERARQAGAHVAEGARARARVAHDRECRVALLPALADVRAARLLAHRMKPVLADDGARLGISGRARRPDADPLRLRSGGVSGRPAFSG